MNQTETLELQCCITKFIDNCNSIYRVQQADFIVECTDYPVASTII